MLGLKKSVDVLSSACQGLSLREISPDLAKAEAAVTSAKERVASLESKAAELKNKLEGLRRSSFDAELAAARKHGDAAADALAAQHEREIQELDRDAKNADYQSRRSKYIVPIAEEQFRAAHKEAVRAFRCEFRKRNTAVARRVLSAVRELLAAVKVDADMMTVAETELLSAEIPGTICGGRSNLGPVVTGFGLVSQARAYLNSESARQLEELEREIQGYESAEAKA